MQLHGATKTELDLLTLLRESEAEPASVESTNKSSILSSAIEELQRLRAIADDPNQELTQSELTERFYLVRGQRDKLIAAIQKCAICSRRMKVQDQSEADLIASGGIVNPEGEQK